MRFEVPGNPVPQPRPRVTVRGGQPRGYVPAKHPIHGYRAKVAAIAKVTARDAPLTGPIRLDVHFVFEVPKSMRRARTPHPGGAHTKKPDASNLLKGLEDALDGVAWLDDAQVCDISVRKSYAPQGEPGRTVVEITPAT